ncbi:MAG: Sec-independent protein translocase protein TatB [Ilumatobacteraceae bacterium]|nr:twin-arginine translocase subunit TatB [Acidimicrobiia bacterium]
MFNLSGSEIVIILLLALVVLGPEKLPEAIRRFGRVYGELRRVSKGFQSEFKEAFDEPLRELRETAHMTSDAVKKMMDEPTDDVAPSKIDEPVTNDPASGDESPPEGGTS